MIGNKLSQEERAELLKAPAYVALLAAVKDGEILDVEKEMAEKAANSRAEQGDPALRSYYEEVSGTIKETMERMSTMLPADTGEKTEVLGRHLERVKEIMEKLDEEDRQVLDKSLRSLANRVKRADRSFFQYFMVPFGISEDDDEMNNEGQSPSSRHYAP